MGKHCVLFGREYRRTAGVFHFLPEYAFGTQHNENTDGVEAGWTAGEDILDIGFDLAKNIVNNALHFSLRLDTLKLPADLLRAYVREELQALAADNRSGRPSTNPCCALGRKFARFFALFPANLAGFW